MTRRLLLLCSLGLAGCSVLPQTPYPQRREWPLAPRRPAAVPPPPHRPVLLVRSMVAAPGLDARGLQWRLPDGSLHVDFYEQWAVPPAEAIGEALRHWLARAGLFAAVIGPGSRLPAGLVLEPELTQLQADPRAGVARAAFALVLLDERPGRPRVLLQQTVTADASLAGDQPSALAAAMQEAVTRVLAKVEQVIAATRF